MTSADVTQPPSSPRERARSRGHYRARAGLSALLVGAALVTGAIGQTVAPLAKSGSVRLVDAYGPGGRDGGARWTPSSAGTSTVDSYPATRAESTGVVLIETVLPYENAEAAGTGMILTANGQVLTNHHVVEGAGAISVTVATTGMTYTATVVGSDESDDVALLQLKGASGLATVDLDTDGSKAGEAVTAVGNAGGTGTMTAADGSIVSLRASVTTAAEGAVASETLSRMIGTDADVIAGDSGGPLLDDDGEVIGMDTAASTGQQINGYAIPIASALTIVRQIRSGAETTTVQIGAAPFLGVELAGSSGASSASEGATISGIVDSSAAAKAGLAAGDTIIRIGGEQVTSADQMSALLATRDPGDRVRVAWVDGSGADHNSTVTLGSSPVA